MTCALCKHFDYSVIISLRQVQFARHKANPPYFSWIVFIYRPSTVKETHNSAFDPFRTYNSNPRFFLVYCGPFFFEARVSIKRLEAFLDLEELDPNSVQKISREDNLMLK